MVLVTLNWLYNVCCALTIVEVMNFSTGGLSDMPVDIRALAVSLACIFPHGVSGREAECLSHREEAEFVSRHQEAELASAS